ncbi:MAG TPA: DUF3592 domain-containing protein [Pirellulaceae bacterium]|nr:DUF3592 domain-containing protein [Pirellulaceae bacterium]
MPQTDPMHAAVPASTKIPLFPRLFMSALALAFFAAGIGLFVQHLRILRTWRPVEATVVRSEVIRFRSNKQRDMYRGAVELAYVVGGRQHQTPDSFKHASSSEGAIRGQMETTYARGTRHRIFYDPENPYSIRWDVGITLKFFLLPIAFTGVGLTLAGVCYPSVAAPLPAEAGLLALRHAGRCSGPLLPAVRRRPDAGRSPRPARPRADAGRSNRPG